MTGIRGAGLVCSLVASLAMAAVAVRADTPPVSQPYRLSPHFAPGDRYTGIRLLGTVELTPASIAGLTLGGLSGLAWDQDASRLYALSDRGSLFHLRPNFENGRLVGAELLAGFALRDPQGRPLTGRRADAEGIVLRRGKNGEPGKSRLAVSFERYPRIVLFTPRGEHVESLHLPADLADPDRYATPNKALESLTWLAGPGYLTAPERALRSAAEGIIDIFALDGRRWRYPLLATPNASLVDMQPLPDGSLLTLERGHGLMFLPIVIALRHTRLTADNTNELLAVTTLAVLDSSQGWSVDNFEGLTRHQGLKFFMVSDDNFSDLQKTLLVYFELVSTDDSASQVDAPEYELRQQKRD